VSYESIWPSFEFVGDGELVKTDQNHVSCFCSLLTS